jgi:hypothetical protein
MTTGYVTNYGNSENDGLSWETPKRSVQNAIDAGLYPVYIKGMFRESLALTLAYLIGDGYAVIDGTLLEYFATTSASAKVYDVHIKNFSTLNSASTRIIFKGCSIYNIETFSFTEGTSYYLIETILFNCTTIKFLGAYNLQYNNTIYGGSITFTSGLFNSLNSHSNIFSNASIHFKSEVQYLSYSLFHNCTFKFTGGDQDADETEYAAPVGDTDVDKLTDLRSRMAAVYGGVSSHYMQYCKYQTDGDLFIDADNENFYLVPRCQAASMSYEAGYIGKYPEGSVAEIPSDFTTYTNINDDGDITDQTVNAYAETAIMDIGSLRHISSLNALGERAVRNGNQVNADADLGDAMYPGTDLTAGSTYLVKTEAISLTSSGTTRDVGETFIASADDGLAFTSDTGYVQEVYLNKPRSIEIKASKTDATLESATWIKLDLYETPYVNYDENGLISAGNLDDDYDEDTAEKMYIRYWKARINIQAKNLPA